MNRNLRRLSDGTYDLCVIGGGIYGACVAWEASLRGLSVALVEKGDFGHATSSKTSRIIHGGIRCLQYGDLAAARSFIRARARWTRIAPHLVHPLPVLIPTYSNSLRTRALMAAALAAYDLLALACDRLGDSSATNPRGRTISRDECLHLAPEVESRGLNGAAIFYDSQVYSSERLLLSILKSAALAGAVIANYVEATEFLMRGGRVTGVMAKDAVTGDTLDIRANVVANTAGPWVQALLDRLPRGSRRPAMALSKAFNLVVDRQYSPYALGVHAPGSRVLFIVPWHNRSLVGTAHLPYGADPDRFTIHEHEIDEFLATLNNVCPGLLLRREQVRFVHGGMLPVDPSSVGSPVAALMRRSHIIDHEKDDGTGGLISVIGAKLTGARDAAAEVVDRVFGKLGYTPAKTESSDPCIHGGSVGEVRSCLADAVARHGAEFGEGPLRRLVFRYGSAYPEVLKYVETERDGTYRHADHAAVLRAEVIHAIREEMALTLADVVVRRTELGILGNPGDECLAACAGIMSEELGWDRHRADREISEVRAAYSPAA